MSRPKFKGMADRSNLAVQLYSLKDQSLVDPRVMLEMVPVLGFAGVETAGDYGWNVQTWHDQLDSNELRLVSAHVLLDRLEQDLSACIDFNTTLGNVNLVVPIPPDGEGRDRYHRCAERLNRVAKAALEQGCHLSYHNHHWEFEPLEDGVTGMEILLAETDPELVSFQLDTAWALAGGGDPYEFVVRHRERISSLHAKEYQMASGGEPDMGEGDVPFEKIVPIAVAEGWTIVVEHEPGPSAPAGIAASANYLGDLMESQLEGDPS